jgi:hypothetical protein
MPPERMTNPASIPIDKLGIPGIPGELVFVDAVPGETRSDNERLTDTAIRPFRVTARLAKNPEPTSSINLSTQPEHGDSYLLAHPHAKYTKIKCRPGELHLFHNSKREISCIRFTCNAESPKQARAKFLDAVSPFIDYLSFKANVPIFVPLVVCEDERNGLQTINYVGPHPSVSVQPHETELNRGLMPIYALYREAKNSISPYYKFLCYFKILEGIYKHLRAETFREARTRGLSIPAQKELVPLIDELNSSAQALVGKPIKEIFDNRLAPEFRDKIAHYIVNDGDILNVSSYGASAEFSNELGLIEACVRVVIEVQESYCIALKNAV